jgi:hypothetical protein
LPEKNAKSSKKLACVIGRSALVKLVVYQVMDGLFFSLSDFLRRHYAGLNLLSSVVLCRKFSNAEGGERRDSQSLIFFAVLGVLCVSALSLSNLCLVAGFGKQGGGWPGHGLK